MINVRDKSLVYKSKSWKDFNNKNTLVEGQKSTNAPLRYEVTTTVRLINKVSQDKVVEICCIQAEYVQTV